MVSYPFWVIKSHRFSGILTNPHPFYNTPKLQALILAPLMKARSFRLRSPGFLFFDGKKRHVSVKLFGHMSKTCFNMVLSGFFYVIVFYKFVCWMNWIHVQVIGLQGDTTTTTTCKRIQDTSFSMRWVHWMLKPEICRSNVSNVASSTSIWDCSPPQIFVLRLGSTRRETHVPRHGDRTGARWDFSKTTRYIPPLRAKIAAEVNLHICAWLFHVTPVTVKKNIKIL